MTDFTAYTEIILHGEKVDYILSAGYDLDTDKHFMPSLSFYKDYGHSKNQELIECWDNDLYLIESLYQKVLASWTSDKTILDGESFAELIKVNGGAVDDMPKLRELIDKGIDLGFFNEYYNKK